MNRLEPLRSQWRVVAILAIFALMLASVPAAAEETVDTVLAKYYEAVGGEEAWSKVKTIKQEGSMTMMGMDLPFTVYAAEPNKMRIEFEMQGMKGIQALNGDSGWMVMPFMTGSDEPEPLPEDMVREMSASAGVSGPLFDYQEKGNTVELVGKADVEGTDTYHLKVTLDSGKEMHWYLDSEYFVPIQQKMVVNMQGQEFEGVTTLSDYKEVDGLMLPFTTTQSSPMGDQVMTTKSVEVNVDLADDFFAMPATDG